jgi:hypothetical protein
MENQKGMKEGKSRLHSELYRIVGRPSSISINKEIKGIKIIIESGEMDGGGRTPAATSQRYPSFFLLLLSVCTYKKSVFTRGPPSMFYTKGYIIYFSKYVS